MTFKLRTAIQPSTWAHALAIGWLFVAATCPAQPSAFAEATAAFQSGDYARATQLFEAAIAGGTDTPAANYNLGVSQYRSGDNAGAAATFARVRARFPNLAALAEYNRGLALLALEERAAARAAFERARVEGDENLRNLAAAALAQLAPEPARRSRWAGYFDVTAGHDDNVALVDELTLPITAEASSALTELVGYAGRRFDSRVPVRLGASGYLVRYADAPAFDQEALRIDMLLELGARHWRLEVGPHLSQTVLDGDAFEQTLGVALRAARPVSARLTFEIRATYDDVDAPTARYDYIEGSRQRLRLGIDNRGERYRVRLGYEIDTNDRAAASVSPDRGRLVVNVARRIGPRWALEGTLARRESDYDGAVPARSERLTELAAAARRDLGRGWLLGTEYRWSDNDASVAQYAYRSHRIGVAIGRSF